MPRREAILGFVPARLAASRFPGKPLFPILGRPMIEHVFLRARLFGRWDGLYLATCDEPIAAFGRAKGWDVIMTSASHVRCLDRVAEAASKRAGALSDLDIIVCVQGDEPMLQPEMIDAAVAPLLEDRAVPCTVLAMEIAEEAQFRNPDIVKIVHDEKGDVLYTSRSPVPYCRGKFSAAHGARRIYGIFAFRRRYLRAFTRMRETALEAAEACDSNRILDSGFRQRIAPYPFCKSFSVDSPADVKLVEESMPQDALCGRY